MGDNTMTASELLKSLVTDELLDHYLESVAHFGTTDLVMFYDGTDSTKSPTERLTAFMRAAVVPKLEAYFSDNPDSDALQERLSRPASTSANAFSQAFWFLVVSPEGHTACAAVSGQRLSSGGDA